MKKEVVASLDWCENFEVSCNQLHALPKHTKHTICPTQACDQVIAQVEPSSFEYVLRFGTVNDVDKLSLVSAESSQKAIKQPAVILESTGSRNIFSHRCRSVTECAACFVFIAFAANMEVWNV